MSISINPNSGSTAGGDPVTITGTGTNFVNGTTARIGGLNLSYNTVVSATSITGNTPPGSGFKTVDVYDPPNIYYIYADNNNGNLQFVRSTDMGVTWNNATIEVVGNVTHPRLVALDNNNLLAAYNDFNNNKGYFIRSTDGGLSWSVPVVFTNERAQYISLASIDGVNIFITYYNSSRFKFAKSTNSGASWVTSTIDNHNVNNVGQWSALTIVDNNTLFAAYNQISPKQVKFAKSTNGGTSWATSTISTYSNFTNIDNIVALDANRIYVPFQKDNSHAALAISSDGGTSWSIKTVSNLISNHFDVKVLDDGQTIFYGVNPAFGDGLFLATSTDGGTSWSSNLVDINSSQNVFSIAALDDLNIFIAYNHNGNGYTAVTTDGGSNWTLNPVDTSSTFTGQHPNMKFGFFPASSTLPNGYDYVVPPPTVDTINPNFGVTTGGTFVTITGTFFEAGSVATIDGNALTGQIIVDEQTITGNTPVGTAGAKDVTVTNLNGSGTLTNGFTYYLPIQVNSVTPSQGPVIGNTSVTISGQGFLPSTTVTIGGAALGSPSVVNQTTITGVVPAHATGSVDVVATNALGTSTLSNGYTYRTKITRLVQVDAENNPPGFSPIIGLSNSVEWTGALIQSLSTTININALVAGTTNLYTVPVGVSAVIYSAIVQVSAANSITTEADASIGVAAGENDIFASTTLTGTTSANKVYIFAPTGDHVVIPAGGIIKFRVTTPAVGTSETLTVRLLGYLF